MAPSAGRARERENTRRARHAHLDRGRVVEQQASHAAAARERAKALKGVADAREVEHLLGGG